jgi:GNAT superfamily N-acetyltransferase
MGVRSLRIADLPEVAELHRRVTDSGPKTPQIEEAYHRWFSEALFRDPMAAAHDAVGPLVHEDARGAIDGFLAVSPRRMRIAGTTYVAALSSQLIVDPAARSRLVGFALLRRFLSGPQDLSIADEANEPSARLWRSLGGVSSALYGTAWFRPLRPWSLMAEVVARRRPALRPARTVTSVALRALDAMTIRIPGPQRPAADAELRAESLTAESYLEHAPRFTARSDLVPDHDLDSVRWALSRAKGPGRGAPLEASLLRGKDGEPIGLFVATLPAGGIAEVVHAAATERARRSVIRYMIHRAFEAGALSIGGRVHPPLMRAISQSFGILHARGSHMLLHARRPELLASFDRGVATFSRLEGEWCIRFVPPRASRRRRPAEVARPPSSHPVVLRASP